MSNVESNGPCGEEIARTFGGELPMIRASEAEGNAEGHALDLDVSDAAEELHLSPVPQ